MSCRILRNNAPVTDEWFSAPSTPSLDGQSKLIGVDATVKDFWAFAMSDLRMNNVRGYLSEFLVARAIGAVGKRIEWDAYDLISPTGTKVEVKSSAYLQVCDQRRPSAIRFTGLSGRTWTPQGGDSPEATFNADVYVFCVQTAVAHDMYDALDVSQWDFHVLSREAVEVNGYKSIGLATLLRLTGGPVPYGDLAREVERASA